MKYPHVARAVLDAIWAIQPDKFRAIVAFIEAKAFEVNAAPIEAATPRSVARVGSVAVLPLFGTISQRAGMMTNYSGGTSVDGFRREFRSAVQDPGVSAVVLDVDSPGGSVFGVEEMALEIYNAREQKPIVAVANSEAHSAAYWLGSAASEFVAQPSAMVGSIGVIAAHTDFSQANAKAGVDVSYVKAGEFKSEGNPNEPLTDEGLAHLQSIVDAYYKQFVGDVARNRGVSEQVVLENYGQGRSFGADQALARGMIDRIDTLENVVARLQPKETPRRNNARTALRRLQISAPVD